jgi:hypothetical protein
MGKELAFPGGSSLIAFLTVHHRSSPFITGSFFSSFLVVPLLKNVQPGMNSDKQ